MKAKSKLIVITVIKIILMIKVNKILIIQNKINLKTIKINKKKHFNIKKINFQTPVSKPINLKMI